jgi:hypothetical protein
VSVQFGDQLITKLLVVSDPYDEVTELIGKIQGSLQREGIMTPVESIFNINLSRLPSDERVGDVLRDSEEIYALLCGNAGQRSQAPVQQRSSTPARLSRAVAISRQAEQQTRRALLTPCAPEIAFIQTEWLGSVVETANNGHLLSDSDGIVGSVRRHSLVGQKILTPLPWATTNVALAIQ